MSRPAILYRETHNVGHAKYVVSYYSGATHADGSAFYDIRIFRNKKAKDTFIRSLVKDGAQEAR